MIKAEFVIETLRAHTAFDEEEREHLAGILQFLSSTQSPFSRENVTGHITVSAIATDPSMTQVIMIWHKGLRRWLQPGGHVEPQLDHTLSAGALRELIEETGLATQSVRIVSDYPFDLDVHTIPATAQLPEHMHYDVRFRYIVNYRAVLGHDARWVPITGLLEHYPQSIARFASKLLLLSQ